MLLEQLDAAVPADAPCDPGADQVAQHAGEHDLEHREAPVRDLEAGEQHDRLARGRDAGAVEQHQDEDPGQAEVADHVRREVDDRLGDARLCRAGRPRDGGARTVRVRRKDRVASTAVAIPLFDTAAQLREVREEVNRAIAGWSTRAASSSGPRSRRSSASWPSTWASRHVVGVANGTDAITIALRGLGVGPGDDVIVPSFTFYASAEAIPHTGARPVFCDVDPETFCVTAETVERALTPATRAVMPVDLFGRVAPVDELRELLDGRGIAILEDAAQAAGARSAGSAPGASATRRPSASFRRRTCSASATEERSRPTTTQVAEQRANPALPRLAGQEHLHRGGLELAPRRASGGGAARDPGPPRRLERAPPGARRGLRAGGTRRAGRRCRKPLEDEEPVHHLYVVRARDPDAASRALADAGHRRALVLPRAGAHAARDGAVGRRRTICPARCVPRRTNLALPMGPTLGPRTPRARWSKRCAGPEPDADHAANSGLHEGSELREAGGSARKLRKMRKAVTDPVYRHRLLQLTVDAVLVAACLLARVRAALRPGHPGPLQRPAVADDRVRDGRQGGDLRRVRPLPEVVEVRRPARLRVDPEGRRDSQPRDGRRAVRVVADRQRPAALDRGDGPAADDRADRRRRASPSAACSNARRAARCCPRDRRC